VLNILWWPVVAEELLVMIIQQEHKVEPALVVIVKTFQVLQQEDFQYQLKVILFL
jgi:hypothetical protein